MFRQEFACSERGEANPIVLHLPGTLVQGQRNIEATVELFSKSGDFLDEFNPVAVHFPTLSPSRQASTNTSIRRDRNDSWSEMTITPLKSESAQSGKNPITSGQTAAPSSAVQSSATNSVLKINSAPVGADIFLGDDFFGNTPSTINVSAGNHVGAVQRSGYQECVRQASVNGRPITLNAELIPKTDETHIESSATATRGKEESSAAKPLTSSAKPIGWIGVHAQNNGDVAVVTNVSADGPGAKAGIQVGDNIVALDGRLIKGKDFEAAVAALKPGTQIAINYARGSSAREVSVTVGSHNM